MSTNIQEFFLLFLLRYRVAPDVNTNSIFRDWFVSVNGNFSCSSKNLLIFDN